MSETKNIPQHVAIIMDGNGRWAKQRGKERVEGHIEAMAINGAKNAGLFAAQILALTDPQVSAKLDEFRKAQTQKVLDATI